MKIHTAEQSAHQASPSDSKSAIANLKRHKSPGTDQILAEMINTGGET
jgi:hypothetical protein